MTNALREAWDQATETARPKWIRCADLMPQPQVLVLAAVDTSYPFFCEVVAWGGAEWKWPARLKGRPRWAMGWMPTHWMPLPPGPEEDGLPDIGERQ